MFLKLNFFTTEYKFIIDKGLKLTFLYLVICFSVQILGQGILNRLNASVSRTALKNTVKVRKVGKIELLQLCEFRNTTYRNHAECFIALSRQVN